MPKTNIAFFELEKWEEKYLQEKLGDKNLKLKFFSVPLSKSVLRRIKDTNILGVFIYSQVDEGVL